MDILDLDEAQGLTRQAIVTYLGSSWYHAAGDPIERWDKINCAGDVSIWIDPDDLGVSIKGLSRVEKRSPQVILREMNPRLRKGVPSMEARREHRLWLCVCGPGSISVLKVDDYPDEGSLYRVGGMGRCVLAAYELCEFWPCDSAGNKVRWPERDGVML